MELESAKYFENSQPPPDLPAADFAKYSYKGDELEENFFLTICGVNLALFVLIFAWISSVYAVVKIAKPPSHIRIYNAPLAIVGRVLEEHCRTPQQQWKVYWISTGLVIACLTFIGCIPATKRALHSCKASPLAHMVLTIGAQMRGSDAYAFATASVYMILGTLGAVVGFMSLLNPNFDKVGKLETMILMSMLAQVGTVGAIVGGVRLLRELPDTIPIPEDEMYAEPEPTEEPSLS